MFRSIWKRRRDAEDPRSRHACERMKSDFTIPAPKAFDHHHQLGRTGERVGRDIKLRVARVYLPLRVARARSEAGLGVQRIHHMQTAIRVEKRMLVGIELGGLVLDSYIYPF